MPKIFPGTRWTTKPPVGSQLNLDSSLVSGLAGLWLFNENAGLTFRSLTGVGNITTNAGGTYAWTTAPDGAAIGLTAGSATLLPLPNVARLKPPLPLTVYARFVCTSLASQQAVVVTDGLSTNNSGVYGLIDTSGAVTAIMGTGGAVGTTSRRNATTTTTGLVVAGKLATMVCVFIDSNTINIYINGTLQAVSYIDSGTTLGYSASAGRLGKDSTTSQTFGGSISSFGLWSRALNATEAMALSADPWCMIAPPALRRYWVVPAGGTLFTASLSGGVTPAGALTKSTARALAGAMTPSGTLAKQTARSLTGSAASAGTLTKKTSRALTGAAASSGALVRSTGKPLSGSTASSGVLAKSTGRALAGSVASSGALSNMEGKALSGSVASSGAITKSTSKALAGTVAPSGILTKTTSRTLSGSVASSGALAGIKTKLMSFAGSVASGGALALSTAKTLTGTVGAAGSLTKATSKALAGTVTPSGTLTKTLTRALAGTVTSAGVLAKRTGKTMAGSVAIAGSLSAAIGHGVPVVLARATLTMLAAPSATMSMVLVPTATMGVV